jgi:hypothetical protein
MELPFRQPFILVVRAMKQKAVLFTVLVISGIVADLILSWFWNGANGVLLTPSNGTWWSLLYSPLEVLCSVLAPFAVGYLAKEHGFLLGAIVGAFSSPLSAYVSSQRWHWLVLGSDDIPFLISGAIGSAMLSAIACAAGVLAARQLALTTQSSGTSV